MEEIIFGGMPTVPSKEVFEEATRSNPLYYQMLERAVEKLTNDPENRKTYGDLQKGATVEQAWMVNTLFGVFPYCLLSTNQKKVSTSKIKRVIKLSSEQFVLILKDIFNKFDDTEISISSSKL